MKFTKIILPTLIVFFLTSDFINAANFVVPIIDGGFWQVAGNPDLGEYNSPKQQPVDFGIWQAQDGTWQLWSCIRFINAQGHTRLFHGWEGKSITDTDWQPLGITMTSSAEHHEPLHGLQAPHVVKYQDKYWMAYGDWDYISMATSPDGKNFTRYRWHNNSQYLFTEGPLVNTRDAMMLNTKGQWLNYYTAFPGGKGYLYCRTSNDLLNWSDSFIVAYGGKAGNNPYSCECPHVVEPFPGLYVLFRTQFYGPGAQTSVYCSENPFNFGIDNDQYYITKMNLCAPEIVKEGSQYYMVALNPNLDGVRVARLDFKNFNTPVFDITNPAHRDQWQKTGDLAHTFINSVRTAFNAQTEYFIATAETGIKEFDDELTGTIESPAFTFDTDRALLRISGGEKLDKAYVAITDTETGVEYQRFTGSNSNQFQTILLDTKELRGKLLKIKVVDNAAGPWGHINFENIYTESR